MTEHKDKPNRASGPATMTLDSGPDNGRDDSEDRTWRHRTSLLQMVVDRKSERPFHNPASSPYDERGASLADRYMVTLVSVVIGAFLSIVPLLLRAVNPSEPEGEIRVPLQAELQSSNMDPDSSGGVGGIGEVVIATPTSGLRSAFTIQGGITQIGILFCVGLVGMAFDHLRRRHHFEAELVRQWGPKIRAISRLEPDEASALDRIVDSLTRINPAQSASSRAVRNLAKLDLESVAAGMATAADGAIIAHVSLATRQLNRRFCALFEAACRDGGSWNTISCLAFWSNSNLSCSHSFFRAAFGPGNGDKPEGIRYLVIRESDTESLVAWEVDVLKRILRAATLQGGSSSGKLMIVAPRDPEQTPVSTLDLENCAVVNDQISVVMNYPDSEFSGTEQVFRSMSISHSRNEVQRVNQTVRRMDLLVGPQGPLENVTEAVCNALNPVKPGKKRKRKSDRDA